MFDKLLIPDLKKPVPFLNTNEHLKLMQKINQLPFGDGDTRIYKMSLEELFEAYQQQIKKLAETCAAYKEIAELVRERQPLTNTLKYIRVRRLESAQNG